MYIIGLCGRSGSGKSTVAGFISQRGAALIDADEVCRYVYCRNAECIDELCRRFGNDICRNGEIIRPILAKRAYGEENGIADLNRIAHKYITIEIENRLLQFEKAGKKFALLDAPLLFEAGLDKRCHGILAVVAPYCQQLKRLTERDGKTKEEIKKRLAAQIPVAELKKRVDLLIVNDSSIQVLRERTHKALLYLLLKLNAVERMRGRYRVK